MKRPKLKVTLLGLNLPQGGDGPMGRALGLYVLRGFANRIEVIRKNAAIIIKDLWFSERNGSVADLIETDTRVLGLSCSAWSVPWVERIAVEARRINPDILIWFGGDTISLLLQRNRIPWGERDIVFPGYPGYTEHPFRNVLAHLIENGRLGPDYLSTEPGIIWWRSNRSRPVINPPAPYLSLADRPSPNLEGEMPFDPFREILFVTLDQGCRYRCRFCFAHVKQPVPGGDVTPVRQIEKEIDLGVRLGCRAIRLRSAAANDHPNSWRAAVDRIGKSLFEKVDTTLSLFSFDDTDSALLLRQRPGLYDLNFGIQSFTPAACHTAGRKHLSIERLRDLLAPLAGHCKFRIDLLYPLPGDTLAGFQRGVESLLDLGFVRANAYQMLLSPSLPFGRDPVKWGFETDEVEGMIFAAACDGFSRDDVKRAQAWLRSLHQSGSIDINDSRVWAQCVSQSAAPQRAGDSQPPGNGAVDQRHLGGAAAAESRPDTIRLRFEDRSGQASSSDFFLTRSRQGDQLYRELNGTGFWYQSYSSPEIRKAITKFLLSVISGMAEPLALQNRNRWVAALEAEFPTSALAHRLKMSVE